MECTCADCGINVPLEDQYGVVDDKNRDTKIVCEVCMKKYSSCIKMDECASALKRN